MPFSFQPAQTDIPGGATGPRVRTGVKTEADVIDLTAMIAGMESGRPARKPQAGTPDRRPDLRAEAQQEYPELRGGD